MSTNTVDRLHLAVLDGHLMDDATLARLVPECRSLTAFTTDASQLGLAQRWTAIAPDIDFFDGGHVASLREAMVECAKRRIVVISTGVPKDPAKFVALALQGAAAMTEFDVPGVAVHVMRPVERSGTVAWLTDTGELSGYGVLFAVGYAHLHGTGLDLIEPTGGLGKPRTGEALDDALAFAEAAGVPITRHTDPSPFARVLRDEHCLVVHPVLDAPKGFNLLHPGELSRKAVASGNPAVVVDLLEQFPGDVVAVFDGVHLLSGSIPAARIAAGVALGVVAAAGIGTMVASPAMAAPSVSQAAHDDVIATVTGQTGQAHDGVVHVVNTTDHAVTVTLDVTWVATSTHHGQGKNDNHPDLHSTVSNVVVQPGQAVDVPVSHPSAHGQGSYYPGSVQVTGRVDSSVTATPEKEPVVLTGVSVTTEVFSEVDQVVVAQPTTETELETTDPAIPVPPLPQPQVPTQVAIPNPQAPGPEQNVEVPPLPQPQVPTQVAIPNPQAPGPEQNVEVPPLPQPQVPTQVTPDQGPEAVPGPGQKVDEPVLVPPLPEQGTPVAIPNPQAPGPEQNVEVPPLPQPQVPTQVTPDQGPEAVPGPGQKVDEPVLVPPLPEQGTPVAIPNPQAPGPEHMVDEPMLVPPLPDRGTPVAIPNPQAPGPEQQVDEPMLVPPLRSTVTEVSESSIPSTVTSTETPTGVVEVGGVVVTPGVTTDVTTNATTETVTAVPVTASVVTAQAEAGVTTPIGHGPTSHVTHHHTTPAGSVAGSTAGEHRAPEGELAHTGGNTAILAIVAGSLLAAGAGLAVAGRMGKDDPDAGSTEG